MHMMKNGMLTQGELLVHNALSRHKAFVWVGFPA